MKHAFRSLAQAPGFTAVVVLTLALGIGANTAIFSFFRGILLRPLPYHEAERVVALKQHARDYSDPPGVEIGLLAADFRELQPQLRGLQEVTTYTLDAATITGRGDPTLTNAAVVLPNFFSVLGSRALLGRTFTADDPSLAHGRLATVAHDYWQAQLGSDPGVIGRTLVANGVTFTIVGVMPPDFDFPREAQLWVTPAYDVPETAIGQPETDFAGRGQYLRTIVGRLAPGVSQQQAETELNARIAQLPNPNRVQRASHLVNLRDHTLGEVRPALAVLLGCVGLVLLIACLNVANLMLSRATRREREIALRLALGASRARIARLLLGESLLLSLAGGAVGLLVSLWALELLVQFAPADLPRIALVRIDGAVLGFAFLVSVGTGLLSGLAPVLGTTRPDLITALKSGDRAGSAGAAPRRLRATLVAGEVAISLTLLVAAGLLVRSLARMQAFAWGFRPEQVVSARVSFLADRYAPPASRIAFYRALRERLTAQPGIEAFGTSLDRIGMSWIHLPFTPQGHVYSNPADRPQANYHIVSPGYLGTLGIALPHGRDFAPSDDANSQLVVIVDSTLAQRYFPGGDAVGKTVNITTPAGQVDVPIIGVAAAVQSDGPVGVARPDIYYCYLQVPQNNFFVHLRTRLGPAAAEALLRQAVHALDSNVPVTDVATMEQVTARPSAARRFPLGLLGGFAVLALVLAIVGIYAVTGYAVAQRTREIGVRMALGAPRASVVRLVLRQGFGPIAVGLGAGLVGAILAAFAMRRLLFGVAPLDGPTFAAVPLVLVVVATLACLLPARRATKVNPLIALRTE